MSKNIKDISKKLLGQSLNSFHRKTGLTQLEKNNEMQDGILNGILSQVDDAYIEKTEQSNVMHLDGSGDGVVVVDSIKGNTMVNCFKGFDVYRSKYTVFNVTNRTLEVSGTGSYPDIIYKDYLLKSNTTYTLIVNVEKLDISQQHGQWCVLRVGNSNNSTFIYVQNPTNIGTHIVKFTTPNVEINDVQTFLRDGITSSHSIRLSDMIILEGDYTNKEVNYFEGLQSSFEEKVNDEGKYEIEILSNNKNLINNAEGYESSYASWIPYIGKYNTVITTNTFNATFSKRGIGFITKELKPNTTYTLSVPSLLTNNKLAYALYRSKDDISSWGSSLKSSGGSDLNKITFTTPNESVIAIVGIYGDYNILYNNGANDGTVIVGNYDKLQLEVGSNNTNFTQQKQNKIKLLINEPLRAIGDVKDKLCVKDNRLIVKRNCGEIIFNGSEDWHVNHKMTNNMAFWTKSIPNVSNIKIPISDKFKQLSHHLIDEQGTFTGTEGTLYLTHSSSSIEELKVWLQSNLTTMVFPLAEPYYEEVLNEYGEPILLEGYDNGTLYIDSTIIPTTSVRYTPNMKSINTLKEVSDNNIMLTTDINDTIIPYMMEVDMMIMEKEIAIMSHKNIRKIGEKDMTNMQKRTYDMLARLIKGKTLTVDECKTRVTVYLNAGKITDEQAKELNFLIDEIYA
ncbi:MAG: hypothetical protein J6D12_06075 [Peptostreptococcaceae bacterium]|nr:hypothetical protein [Peptostreptococcaceae bacterium]